jgi:uncharacterized protein YbjT (DUF2867 family)
MTDAHTRLVLVIGATGRIGRAVVAELVAAGEPVRALARRPSAAGLPAAVEASSGRHRQPPLRRSSSASPPQARRIVFLSSPHGTPHPFFQQPEAAIERSSAAWNVAIGFVDDPPAGDVRVQLRALVGSGDPRRCRPLACALTDDRHAGGDYVLTGPEALSQAEQVRTIGRVFGRSIGFDELTPDEFRRAMAGHAPAPAIEMLLAAWGAAIGTPAFVTSTIAEILRSPARTFRSWVAEHADLFR